MAFSYLSVLYLDFTSEEYSKGKVLADEKKVEIIRTYNNGCRAIVHLKTDYPVMIGFAKIGSQSYSCVCAMYSYGCICEHIIAVAIAYDQSRGVIWTPTI